MGNMDLIIMINGQIYYVRGYEYKDNTFYTDGIAHAIEQYKKEMQRNRDDFEKLQSEKIIPENEVFSAEIQEIKIYETIFPREENNG